jgi:hypothetical protein
MRLIHDWLSDCDANHAECRRTETFVPARLLKICRAFKNSQTYVVQLIDAGEPHLKCAYIALSYCWGKSKTYKLTTATEPVLRSGLESSCLPQTFQDSIKFATYFNREYLWIDSLCIFQDSSIDWRQQSLSMSYIYSNSWCTISATASSDNNGGLFRQRETQSLRPLVLQTKWECQPSTSYYVTADHMDEITNSPISLRGWTLQERFLSRRTVHFARTQIYWSCRGYNKAGIFPGSLQGLATSDSALHLKWYRCLKAPNAEAFPVSEDSLLDLWCRGVTRYCTARLSEEKDKLVAISGLAKWFQSCLASRNINTAYFAGLWGFRLIHCLLWATSGAVSKRPIQYRAPSWTWAAVKSTITFFHALKSEVRAFEIIAMVHEVWTKTTNDSLGQVSDGWLRIDCFLKEVVLQEITQNFPPKHNIYRACALWRRTGRTNNLG